jgi:hypothetical protein
MGFIPLSIPPAQWEDLWLTTAISLGSLSHDGGAKDALEGNQGATRSPAPDAQL